MNKKEIKNIISLIGLFSIFALAGCGAGMAMDTASVKPQNYIMEGTVIEQTDNYVTVETKEGSLWELEEVDIKVGYTTNFTFSNNGTPFDITDDKIIDYEEK